MLDRETVLVFGILFHGKPSGFCARPAELFCVVKQLIAITKIPLFINVIKQLFRDAENMESNPDRVKLTAQDLLKWCVQIVNALSHLDEKKVMF